MIFFFFKKKKNTITCHQESESDAESERGEFDGWDDDEIKNKY
jgi:hypothetical protein